MQRQTSLKGRNISMDRLYTSIDLTRWLYTKNITFVGTMVLGRVGIPAEVKVVTGREENSTKTYFEKNCPISLTSYVVNTKSKGKKNILVLSTMPPLLGVTKDDGKDKPAIIKLYDFTKIGTDIVDQINARSTTKTCSLKWTRVGFTTFLIRQETMQWPYMPS